MTFNQVVRGSIPRCLITEKNLSNAYKMSIWEVFAICGFGV